MIDNSSLLSSFLSVLGLKQTTAHLPNPPISDMTGTNSPLLRMPDIVKHIFYAVPCC